jgi:hypothetical protein
MPPRPPRCLPPFSSCTPPPPLITTTDRPAPSARSIGGYIERMWAYRSIEKMLDTAKYGGVSQTEATSLKDKALKLSLKVGA